MESVTYNIAVKSSSGFAALPVEIIYQILLLLDPQELILLHRVSKQFYAITNDRTFWRAAYANARLSRPPGPFDWQSTRFFQRTLVRSARLEKCWTSQPTTIVSAHPLALVFHDGRKGQMVCGRWLFFLRERRQLWSRDMDTSLEQILYRWNPEWIKWSATWRVTATGGHGTVYVLLCAGQDGGSPGYEVCLLEFQTDDDSGYISGPVIYQVPVIYRTDDELKVEGGSGGDTPFVFICIGPRRALPHALVFDTRSHTFYKFPPEMATGSPFYRFLADRYDELVLTTTYIIISFNATELNRRHIRAYMIPDDNEMHMLRLSHETITHDESGLWSLLRNPSIDPISGSTTLRLLGTSRPHPEDLQFQCVGFTFPSPARDHVLPISIDIQPVLTFANATMANVVEPSVHGLARGLCVILSGLGEGHICKFSIDGTDKQCVGVVGDPSRLWPSSNHHQSQIDSFDGSRGRICYTDNVSGDATIAVVLNLE